MKAKNHIKIGILVFILILVLFYFYFKKSFLGFISDGRMTVGTMILGILGYYIGLILPDADTVDKKSRIFYTKWFILGYLSRFIELFLAPILGRKKGHRESMHTIIGILVSSFMITFLFILILVAFNSYSVFSIPLIFTMSFFGQFVHLICDWHWHWK